jgi:hypothetical protein
MMVLPAMLFCTTYLAPMVRTGAHMARAAVRMETGVAQRWNAQKGFGFIQPDDGGDGASLALDPSTSGLAPHYQL